MGHLTRLPRCLQVGAIPPLPSPRSSAYGVQSTPILRALFPVPGIDATGPLVFLQRHSLGLLPTPVFFAVPIPDVEQSGTIHHVGPF